jgi:hypothetical protein
LTLKVPYKKLPNAQGGIEKHAFLNVQIARPEKNAPRTKRFEVIIDSGASRCVFHTDIGQSIGLDVMSGAIEPTYGVSGEATNTYLHDIAFYAPGGIIQITAGFTANLPVAGVLGMKGFFEHFKITFDPTAEQVELERIYKA